MFTQNQSYEYLSILQSVTDSINNSPSCPLVGIAPSDVTKRKVEEVRYSAYLQRNKRDGVVSKGIKNSKKNKNKRT